MPAPATIRLKATDVVVAAVPLEPGRALPDGLVSRDAIPAGHDFASAAIAPGEPVDKFDQIIGIAAPPSPKPTGCTSTASPEATPKPASTKPAQRRSTPPPPTFRGYRCTDGRAGTRNMIGIPSRVNCSATVSRLVAREAERLLADHPGIDGIVRVVHGAGCCLATSGGPGGNTSTARAGLDKLREIGSDGYSGLTATPAQGAADDLLVSLGGTVILCATPEIYGAEHIFEGVAIEEKEAEIFIRIVQVASGDSPRSELFGSGDDELIAWQPGTVP